MRTIDKTERFVFSSEEELVDLSREFTKYIRNVGFWDQFNKGNRLMMISLTLMAFFASIIISSLVGLV
jgi:hypothetical protein